MITDDIIYAGGAKPGTGGGGSGGGDVQSVNGKNGAVILTGADINTSSTDTTKISESLASLDSSIDSVGGTVETLDNDLEELGTQVAEIQTTVNAIPSTYATKSEIPEPYTLPAATMSTLGGVKPDGLTIQVTTDGTISAQIEGGITVTAVNKTGTSITSGEKVWLNQNSTIAGSHYNTGNDSGGGGINTGSIYPTGNKIYVVNYIGNLTATEYTRIGTAVNTNAWGNTRYLDNGGFVCCKFIGTSSQYFDENNNIDIGVKIHIGENYFGDNNGTYVIDLATGEIQTTWTVLTGNIYDIKIGDYIYRLDTSHRKYTLPSGGGEATYTTYGYTGTQQNLLPLDVTTDNRYIICTDNGSSSPISGSNHNLKMIEVVDENTLHHVSKGEMPVDLQPFYDINCYFQFNKQTGILTCATYKGTDYVVMKYSNGTWTKLSVDLGIEEGRSIYGAISFSNDMTRAVVPLNPTGSYDEIRIINLTTQSGYIAQNYGFYNVTADTITGISTQSASADESFSVAVTSQAVTNSFQLFNGAPETLTLSTSWVNIPVPQTYKMPSTSSEFSVNSTNDGIVCAKAGDIHVKNVIALSDFLGTNAEFTFSINGTPTSTAQVLEHEAGVCTVTNDFYTTVSAGDVISLTVRETTEQSESLTFAGMSIYIEYL